MARKKKADKEFIAILILSILAGILFHPVTILVGAALACVFLAFRALSRKSGEQQREESVEMEVLQPSDEPIEQQFERLIVRDHGIALKKDELCIFAAAGAVGKQKTKNVGYGTLGVRNSVKILGSRVYAGAAKVQQERKIYWEKTPCRFFVTSARFIALAENNGFTVQVDKVMDIKLHTDCIEIFTGNKAHVVFCQKEDVVRFATTWKIVGEAKKAGVDFSKYFANNDKR